MAETVVIANDELADIQALSEDFIHKIACRQRCHRTVEMQHHGIVDLRPRQQNELGVERGQQLRLVVLLENLARMLIESDYRRLHSAVPGLSYHLIDKVPVSAVHAIKETNGRHKRLGRESIVV